MPSMPAMPIRAADVLQSAVCALMPHIRIFSLLLKLLFEQTAAFAVSLTPTNVTS